MSDEPKKPGSVNCQCRDCDKVATRHCNFPIANSPEMLHLCEQHWESMRTALGRIPLGKTRLARAIVAPELASQSERRDSLNFRAKRQKPGFK
jgi:hypothetical protein